MNGTHLAFSLPRRCVKRGILIPKYYDPDLEECSRLASRNFVLAPLGDLLLPGQAGSRLGDWVPREFYGTGDIPYVRTSDLSDWRIRPDFKKGLSEEVYLRFRDRQNVAPGDLLLVAHGTYLVGTPAIVTNEEPRLVLQDHVFRLKVAGGHRVSSEYLLAALSTQFVRRQMRARQFSADIIDKIGERHIEVMVPIPKDDSLVAEVTHHVRKVLADQSRARGDLFRLLNSDLRITRERSEGRLGFSVSRSSIRGRVLIPKYYDPTLEADLKAAREKSDCDWRSIRELVMSGQLNISSGVEVGKMAYGTGTIPFIRTSDLANLEIRTDNRHCVSESIYSDYCESASLLPGDVLVVRDGTYLVGSSAMVSEYDTPALFCGGLLRLRSTDHSRLSPHVLLAALNDPAVRRQMRARQFTRDVIDTLGDRLLEVVIPIPSSDRATDSARVVSDIMHRKQMAKQAIKSLIRRIEPEAPPVVAGRPSWSMR